MEISKETNARIAREAKAHVREVYAHATFEKDSDYDGQTLDSYIAGAEAEATRAAGLVEKLEWLEGWVSDRHGSDNPISKEIIEALSQYNK